MIITVLALLAVVSVLVAGGSPARIAEIRLRGTPFLLGSLLLQVLVVTTLPHWDSGLLAGLHVASYVLGGAFVVANRHVPGLWLVAAGGFANALAIAANGGVMPASASAVAAAGLADSAGTFANSAVVEAPRLWFLGDIFAIPAGWPLANVFSFGDVAIVAGIALGLHRISGSRLVPRRLRRPAHDELTVRLKEAQQAP